MRRLKVIIKPACDICTMENPAFYLPEYKIFSCGLHLNRVLREGIELSKDKKVIVEVRIK